MILLLGLAGLAAWITAGARLEPADFTFNNGTEIATLDPATVTGVPEGRILRAIFEGLTVKDPETLDPLPGMAESWQISEDGLVYTFQIRRGAKWTNGDPVTAHDFTYSWERFLNPETAAEYAYQLWYVVGAEEYTTDVTEAGKPARSFDSVGIRALDDYTLEVRLKAPTPFFLQLTAFYPLFPVNKRNHDEAKRDFPGNDWKFEWLKPDKIVTNGPYRIVERRVNDRIRMVKNETYWDADSVALGSIDALAVEQYLTNLNLYLQGDCSWINYIPNQLITRLLDREDFRPTGYFGSYFFRVNVEKPPLDDLRVRRALALTIDRQSITKSITKSGQEPWYGFVPKGMLGFEVQPMDHQAIPGDEFASGFARDVEEAKQLLADAGYGPGGKRFPTIEILYNTSETHRDIAEVLSDSWKRHLGITAKLLNQEWKVYLASQSSLDYDVSRSAWIGDYLDPNTFLDLFVTGGENNKTGWSNADYDRLIAEAQAEPDPEERYKIFEQAEQILMRELPILPVYSYSTQNIFSPRLGGFEGNPLDELFPKWWYWRSDEEVAALRATYPRDENGELEPGYSLVELHGPPEGQYPPNAPDGQFPEGDPRHRLSPLSNAR